MIGVHFSRSASISLAKSAGCNCSIGSSPASVSFALMAGSLATFANSSRRRWMMPGGVPAGAPQPNQVTTSKAPTPEMDDAPVAVGGVAEMQDLVELDMKMQEGLFGEKHVTPSGSAATAR